MADEHEFSLVVPFVVCESNGGPYDDSAYAAGFECAQVDLTLAQEVEELEQTVRVANLPQLDLIAMQRGYVMSAAPYEEVPDEWATAAFRRVTRDE